MKQRFSTRTRLVSALLTLAMVFTFLPFSAFAAEGDIEIKDINNFPDKKFAADIHRHDTNVDGYLSKQERDNVTEMNLGPNVYGLGRNIESLKGIEYFPKLELLECPYNKITKLNTSSNSELKILTCSHNQLTQLNVSGNDALTTLSCGDNQLAALDVSGNPNLTLLDCYNNQLTFLDLSNNVKLEITKFKCSGNKYPITIDATTRTFDLNDLPTGFDVSKAGGWVGGTVDGNTLKVNPGADRVTYIYNCGNGLSAEFALNVNDGTGSVTPPSGGGSTGGSDGGTGIAVLAIGGAAVAGLVGYGVYSYVSEQQLKALLPEGVAVPENRVQTALLLWNTAGRPEPADAPAFADVTDPDTAKAAQWCVEQGLMKRRLNGKFAPGSSIPAYQVLNAYRKLAG